ncbi:bacteriorhodopsin [Halosimplex aquaticum]|uniref:Bacteriorhodopsin n=1 Tax=Halosimplex aquaticum TaxID=3026162 RepID=A0ABD5XYM3_9EURY|nr:bacteriorhodopsin [Halosimplex aquaticum]
MIDLPTVSAVAAACYALATVGLIAWLRRVPESKRLFCYPVVAAVGISAVTTALSLAGVGVLTVNGTALDVPSVLDDLIAYPLLWAVAALLANESRKMVGVFALVPAVQVVAFNGASVVGGVVGLVGIASVVGGHVYLTYLLFGPVWERARRLPDRQRLLHWKARNLLLFLIGMLIVFAVLGVAGVFDAYVSGVIGEYLGALIRVGFAGFLFANVDAIAAEGTAGGLLDAVNAESNRDRAGAAGGD